MKFHKDPPCGSCVTACSQKDGWTGMLKLTVASQSDNVTNIITVVLREIWCDNIDWIHAIQYTYQLLRIK